MSRYCVVFYSSTVGKKSHLVSKHTKKKPAESEARMLNRGAGMGGFYNTHICKNLGPAFRKEIGLEGRRRR